MIPTTQQVQAAVADLRRLAAQRDSLKGTADESAQAEALFELLERRMGMALWWAFQKGASWHRLAPGMATPTRRELFTAFNHWLEERNEAERHDIAARQARRPQGG
jgi:hypothetical protein